MGEWPSQAVNDFRGRRLPEPAVPAGYAALIAAYDLALPLPPRMTAIAERHHPKPTTEWNLLTPRHQPDGSLAGHLVFALKWEGVDLAVLARLFRAVDRRTIEDLVRDTPNGAFARRAWFLYEWLTGMRLDIPDGGKVRLVPVVDPDQQYAIRPGEASTRHRVVSNLPGTPAFCPMVRRTGTLAGQEARRLDRLAREQIGRVRRDLVARAAAFLLLNDSKSSFAIEGESPTAARAARWGQAIAEAGAVNLSVDELNRLQRIVIGDDRFVTLGPRTEGSFVGVHDRDTGAPIPDHVSARPEDLPSLLGGLIDYGARSRDGGLDPVVAAAALAFGFVYVHPYADGNGRLHRWLIHHVLASAGFNPPGLVFPVSAVILRRLDDYLAVLESYSRPLLPEIDWRPTDRGNVEVLNETADHYRYFDATKHAEYLYACVAQTITEDLPNEVRFLQSFDRFSTGVQQIVDMPSGHVELLERFLQQNGGALSKRAQTREFEALTDAEVRRVEALYAECFGAA